VPVSIQQQSINVTIPHWITHILPNLQSLSLQLHIPRDQRNDPLVCQSLFTLLSHQCSPIHLRHLSLSFLESDKQPLVHHNIATNILSSLTNTNANIILHIPTHGIWHHHEPIPFPSFSLSHTHHMSSSWLVLPPPPYQSNYYNKCKTSRELPFVHLLSNPSSLY
jgi:hypothetical protein